MEKIGAFSLFFLGVKKTRCLQGVRSNIWSGENRAGQKKASPSFPLGSNKQRSFQMNVQELQIMQKELEELDLAKVAQ